MPGTFRISFLGHRRLGNHGANLGFTFPQRLTGFLVNNLSQFVTSRFNYFNEPCDMGLTLFITEQTPTVERFSRSSYSLGNLIGSRGETLPQQFTGHWAGGVELVCPGL